MVGMHSAFSFVGFSPSDERRENDMGRKQKKKCWLDWTPDRRFVCLSVISVFLSVCLSVSRSMHLHSSNSNQTLSYDTLSSNHANHGSSSRPIMTFDHLPIKIWPWKSCPQIDIHHFYLWWCLLLFRCSLAAGSPLSWPRRSPASSPTLHLLCLLLHLLPELSLANTTPDKSLKQYLLFTYPCKCIFGIDTMHLSCQCGVWYTSSVVLLLLGYSSRRNDIYGILSCMCWGVVITCHMEVLHMVTIHHMEVHVEY